MSRILKLIRAEVEHKNRNHSVLCVGKPGTGKSWSMLRMGEALDETFTVDSVIYDIEELLDKINSGEISKGQCVLLDEAGIIVSNRESYMNKYNKAMSHILQTWRHRNIILLVTVPNISYIDKGLRSMFDSLCITREVVKSRGVVKVDWKFIQTNYQMGKTYYHRAKSALREVLNIEIGKPTLKIRRTYEKRKVEFTSELYEKLKGELKGEEIDTTEIDEMRRCKVCNNLGDYKRTKERWECRKCPHIWPHSPIEVIEV